METGRILITASEYSDGMQVFRRLGVCDVMVCSVNRPTCVLNHCLEGNNTVHIYGSILCTVVLSQC